jgi:hypothetical protein
MIYLLTCKGQGWRTIMEFKNRQGWLSILAFLFVVQLKGQFIVEQKELKKHSMRLIQLIPKSLKILK